jgi:hypothetical protein
VQVWQKEVQSAFCSLFSFSSGLTSNIEHYFLTSISAINEQRLWADEFQIPHLHKALFVGSNYTDPTKFKQYDKIFNNNPLDNFYELCIWTDRKNSE